MHKNIIVSDETDTDSVALLNVTCDFSHLGGPATGLVWDGPFAPGDHFDCAGTLPALGYDAVHADRAHVSAIGFTSEKPVSDQNDWYGYTDEAPVTPPTPVMPPVTPVVPVTPGRGNVTVPTLPVVPNELPQTGPSTSLPVWLPLAAGTLTYAVLLRIRRRA